MNDFKKYLSEKDKFYKVWNVNIFSNLWIVSMSPGDPAVAGCFDFSGGLEWKMF